VVWIVSVSTLFCEEGNMLLLYFLHAFLMFRCWVEALSIVCLCVLLGKRCLICGMCRGIALSKILLWSCQCGLHQVASWFIGGWRKLPPSQLEISEV
jgi:hypothetical protein